MTSLDDVVHDLVDSTWSCQCGNTIEDGLHCADCGLEPPWGCDCSSCQDLASEKYEDDAPYLHHPYDDQEGEVIA